MLTIATGFYGIACYLLTGTYVVVCVAEFELAER